MAERTWHSGPPPHVGWWNASRNRFREVWRWWDGACWSLAALQSDSPRAAAEYAQLPDRNPNRGCIVWSDYWPENAHTQRIKPEDSQC